MVVEGSSHLYNIRGVSPAGVESAPTHDIEFRYDSVPPSTPSGLVATPAPNAIRLSWNPVTVADLASYRVYRDGARFAEALREPLYLDMPVSSDQSHRYEVTARDERGNESPRSTSAIATSLSTMDVTPPSAPSGFASALESGGIRLSWNPNGDSDLAGYFIYRRLDGQASFVRVPGTSLLAATTFLDGQLENGRTYVYAVTAVDMAGNESPRSAEASAIWLAPVVDTGANTLGSVYPWCGIVVDSGRMQFLVPAGDFARNGNLANLGLWIRAGDAVYHNVTVKLAHTGAIALQNTFEANLTAAEPQTTVFGPASVNTATSRDGEILSFPFAAPFAYDGARNLLVEIFWRGDDGRTVVFGLTPTPGRRLRLWEQPDNGGGIGTHEQNQQFLRFTFSN